MKGSLPRLFIVAAAAGFVSVARAAPGWETRWLVDEFYSEGAAFGDVDGDGKGDLVSGSFWWRGPEFAERFSFREPVVFDVKRYSDSFFNHVLDVNGDGREDVLVFGFPGKDARVYLNPGEEVAKTGVWDVVEIADQVCHESPALVDIVPGGLPEIVCAREKAYGYYEANPDATKAWTWRAVSKEGEAVKPFGHGMGTGDIDGDGDIDVIERYAWWENPGSGAGEGIWKKHVWALVPYGRGGAQIYVHDVDGDGLNDLVTSLNGHGYGLAWFRQVRGAKGARTFKRHDIMGESSMENPFGVAFSQLHAVELQDMDGDGLKDIVTGKRRYAHGGKDPGGGQEAVVYWFQCVRGEEGVEFVPRLVDNDSGVGVEVLVADLDGNGKLDIVSGNKRGVAIHLQGVGVLSEPARWKVPGGRPDADYAESRSPSDAASAMEVPEGFAVDLIAAEPEVVQPIAMCFDARGRLWVAEGMSYPVRRADEEAADRILIFEDGDGDGSFETRKVFAENLNLVSGIEVGFGGVWVGAAPYLHFYADADGDDRPDGDPEVLLDGWHYEDTHETLNSFTWGPDGWLYGCHGVFTHSVVGVPGTPEAERTPIDAGIWRYHPTRHEFEVFAEGTSNPWGVDFDEKGDWFLTACVIPHFYHVVQGARYFRQGGQHFNPYIYEDIVTISDHLHYGDGTFASANASGKVDRALTRDKPAETSEVGGGHAHCGLAIYNGDVFPEEYRGDFFFYNLHGHRMVRERVEFEGSGYVARHRPDFALAKDHSFIGVGVMLGPDGALYASDWHDPQTCHHRDVEIWDRSDGRIFRIRYGERRSTKIGLPGRSDLELAETLRSENAFLARQAQRLLQERAVAGTLHRGVAGEVRKLMGSDEPRKLRLRGLWAGRVCGIIGETHLAALLEDGDAYVRGWAVQLLAESEEALSAEVQAKFVALAREDPSAVVRRYLAAALQRIPFEHRWDIIAELGTHPVDRYDRNIPLLTWYGTEPLVGEDPERALALAERVSLPRVGMYAGRRAAVTPEGRDALLSRIAKAGNQKTFSARAAAFLAAVEGVPSLERPPSWDAVREAAKKYPGDGSVLRLGARLGDAESFPHWRKIVRNTALPGLQRSEALKLLTLGRDPELGAIAAGLIDRPPLRAQALGALRGHVDDEVAHAVVAALPQMPLQLRNDAVNLLASRAGATRVLLRAIEAGELDASLVSLVLLRQMRQLKDGEVNGLLDTLWGRVNKTPEGLGHEVFRWKRTLNPERLARADRSRGREVFSMTCGTCHRLFGSGIALGPDLTGSNRANLDYLLENVLAPNAVVGVDYQLNVFTLKDGGVVSGMVRREDEQVVTIALPGGTEVAVDKKTVADRNVMSESLMPAGLFEALPENDVVNLVAYLGSPVQVPLSDAGADVESSDDPLEGEVLVAGAKVSAGEVRAQGMKNFPEGSWSGAAQLWWTGGKPGATMELLIPVKKAGVYDLRIDFTTAKDYATIRVSPDGLEARDVDLYSPTVMNAEPLVWEKFSFDGKANLPVKVEITGANREALERFMVGIDRFVLAPVRGR